MHAPTTPATPDRGILLTLRTASSRHEQVHGPNREPGDVGGQNALDRQCEQDPPHRNRFRRVARRMQPNMRRRLALDSCVRVPGYGHRGQCAQGSAGGVLSIYASPEVVYADRTEGL